MGATAYSSVILREKIPLFTHVSTSSSWFMTNEVQLQFGLIMLLISYFLVSSCSTPSPGDYIWILLNCFSSYIALANLISAWIMVTHLYKCTHVYILLIYRRSGCMEGAPNGGSWRLNTTISIDYAVVTTNKYCMVRSDILRGKTWNTLSVNVLLMCSVSTFLCLANYVN